MITMIAKFLTLLRAQRGDLAVWLRREWPRAMLNAMPRLPTKQWRL
jgi:hypothetical protein